MHAFIHAPRMEDEHAPGSGAITVNRTLRRSAGSLQAVWAGGGHDRELRRSDQLLPLRKPPPSPPPRRFYRAGVPELSFTEELEVDGKPGAGGKSLTTVPGSKSETATKLSKT